MPAHCAKNSPVPVVTIDDALTESCERSNVATIVPHDATNSAAPIGVSVTEMLFVAGLRALATTAAVAAGGVGGVFVPFLAIGDVSGRALAPMLGVPPDLAGAAGAAGGISGGYRLPVTAVAMVVGVGGPFGATLTCLATVVVAAGAGLAVAVAIERLTNLRGTGSRIVDDG